MITDSAVVNDFQSLAHLKKGAREQSPEAIKEVAKQFESLFVKMMLKSMRDTIPENELFGSKAEKMYQDMHDKQLSTDIANGRGIGLASVIERQLGGVPDSDINEKPVEDYINNPRPVMPYSKSNVTLSRLRSDFFAVTADTQTQQKTQVDTEVSNLWHSKQAFIEDVWPHALRASEKLGVDAEVLMAQSALETGWGEHLPVKADGSNSFNLFGIKADQRWSGDKVEITTREFRHGVMQHEQAAFRTYDSVSQAFDDYTNFIMENPRYQKALEHGYDPSSYASELQRAGYATDPDYASKINRIRASEELQSKVSELKALNKVPLT
ncbi:MAG: flagellar assembly peptidoglycan hydrolase FlgJ [Gammaproteobacteria bacterium]|nr:flagellar assembly peptidoglycan hydrolase FlgJ [Gammaproteobacteria bacterium]